MYEMSCTNIRIKKTPIKGRQFYLCNRLPFTGIAFYYLVTFRRQHTRSACFQRFAHLGTFPI